jgi:hypothetical protein
MNFLRRRLLLRVSLSHAIQVLPCHVGMGGRT